MTNFHIGQRVVCIWGGPWFLAPLDWTPMRVAVKKGGIYQICRIDLAFGRALLTFEEIGDERYCSTCFRPVIERKTDISIFEELLLRKDVREPERV